MDYPFTAIVGQEQMRLALLLNAIDPRIGGVLIRGEKGTAKSTMARSLAGLLPAQRVVRDCPYGCDPDDPAEQDDEHRGVAGLPVVTRPMPLVTLPMNATEDRVAGTLDVRAALTRGEYRFEPGLLAAAHRGILYIDEVNLLPDHLVDLILDAAAAGRNTVEREGVSVTHPARFMLIGTMNPEEGELRPQLLDRFGLCVEVAGITEVEARVEVMRRRMAFEADPAGFVEAWRQQEAALRAGRGCARDRGARGRAGRGRAPRRPRHPTRGGGHRRIRRAHTSDARGRTPCRGAGPAPSHAAPAVRAGALQRGAAGRGAGAGGVGDRQSAVGGTARERC
jgi:Mg-chelatase subunit ChlI